MTVHVRLPARPRRAALVEPVVFDLSRVLEPAAAEVALERVLVDLEQLAQVWTSAAIQLEAGDVALGAGHGQRRRLADVYRTHAEQLRNLARSHSPKDATA